MSQYDFGNLESPLSGTALINTHLEPWRNALHSLHSGSSRPSYAQAGTMWLDNTTNPWILKVFDGSDDITLGTLNTSTNTFLGAGISSFGATLIDDADASAARTTLGLGTVATENTVPANKGGTGQSSYTVGDLLYASGTTALSKLAAGTNGHVLTLATGVPTWAAPSAGAMELITTSIASNSTTIDFNNLNSTYDHYIVVMSDVQPATDDAFFRLRTSSNNGSSYDAGAGNYRYSGTGNSTGGVLTQYSSASDTHIALTWPTATAGLSNVSTEAFSGTVTIYKPSGSTNFTQVNFSNAYTPSAASQFISTVGGGCRTAAADVDAIRFLMSSGNIASGTFKLYGVKNA